MTDLKDLETLRHLKINKRFRGMTPEELAVYKIRIATCFPGAAAAGSAGIAPEEV